MPENNDIRERVINMLDKIRPYLQSDGGDISLVEITDDNVVKVRLQGACYGCPFSLQTLKAGVEQALIREIPEVKRVVSVD
ncbi:MAG: NifU family protein [Bacteroidales bacterium]